MKRTVNWLPDLSIDHLIHKNEEAADTIEVLKQSLALLGGSQAQTTVEVQTAKSDIEEVKTATATMGGQLAEMMVANATATE